MSTNEFIDELITELAFRLDSGIPDLKKQSHLELLEQILIEWNMGEIGTLLIQMLSESVEKSPDDEKYSHKAYGYYVRKGDEDKEDAQIYRKEGDKYVSVNRDEYDKKAKEQGELGATASGATGDTPTDGSETQQQPQTGTALNPNTEAGKEYTENLPEDDPARKNKVVYPLGGGYYSDTPDGEPMYKRVDEINETIITVDTANGDEDVTMKVLSDKETEQAEKNYIDRKNFSDKNPKTQKDAPNGPTQQQILDDLNNGSLEKITEYQNEVEVSRAAGIAGAGGPVASEGEAKYCNACNLDKEQWRRDNEIELQSIKNKLADKRTADEERTAAALGLELDSPQFLDILAEAQLFCNQKTAEVKADKNSVLYKKGKKGFADARVGNKIDPEGAYCEWMKVGYFGSIATAQRLDESKIDTSQPHKVVQSTSELDDAVQAHLEDMYRNADTKEDLEYYEKQLELFTIFRKYHDTFAIGKDKNGRTTIVSISNKKDSQARDPQNNTTPAQRLRFIKGTFGEEIAESVARVIDNGVQKVSNVQAETIRSQTKMVIDDDVVKVCEQDRMVSYMEELTKRATDGKHRFSKFLTNLRKDWNSISTKEKLELMQEYAKSRLYDENGNLRIISKSYEEDGEVVDGTFYINDNGYEDGPIKSLGDSQIGLPFDPFGKIAIKLGEFKANEETIGIKKTEKDLVTEVHTEVTEELFKADSEEGGYHPEERPDADNGKNTQAYILGTMKAMHIDTYIDMDDNDDDAILIQMGVNGIKPSMIRNCVAEKSGFTEDVTTTEGKKSLKEFLLKRCRVTPGGDRVKITDNGKEIELFEDTWRTAGTSQKVASGFGKDMRECLQEKAKLT